MFKRTTITVLAAAGLLTLGTAGGAVAGGLVTSSQIQNQTIKSVDIAPGAVAGSEIRDRSIRYRDMSGELVEYIQSQTELPKNGVDGKDGSDGKDGADGKDGINGSNGSNGRDGKDSLITAYYATAYYNAGDTNAGAIATVACQDPSDVAISGGAQVLGLDDGANARNTPVSSSFPGRMDWSTNTPKVDRLDGWIVQFGGNAGATSDKAPEKVKVYALCVPGNSIPVVETFKQQ